MKKLYTLIIFMLTVALANAANFEVLFGPDPANLSPVANGSTYDAGYTEDVIVPGVMSRYTQNSNLYVKAPAGTKLSVRVECATSVQVCSFDGTCQAGTNVTKSGVIGEKQQPVESGSDIYDLLIDKVYNAKTDLTDIAVTVSVYETENPSSKVTVTVNMLNKPQSKIGSVNGVNSVPDYLKVGAGNVIVYNFANEANVEIVNIAGKLVYRGHLSGHGTLNLHLSKGVYIYRANRLTGKLLLK